MDHREAGAYWNANAEAWTRLSRAGYDVYRDHLNTPAFLAMLPDVRGLSGLDVGCGEAHNTRQLVSRGARMYAIDYSDVFLGHAQQEERDVPLGIAYARASAVALPFAASTFDFVTGFMSFMDIPETPLVIGEVARVLKPGGFVQFSIEHPCYATPHRRNLRDVQGRTYAFEIGDYYRRQDGEIAEWTFSAAPPEAREGLPVFRTPRFNRTLSEWCNMVVVAGLTIERMEEPRPAEAVVRQMPKLQDARVVPYFLHVRARK